MNEHKIFENILDNYGHIAKQSLESTYCNSDCCGDEISTKVEKSNDQGVLSLEKTCCNTDCCGDKTSNTGDSSNNQEVLSLGCFSMLVESAGIEKGMTVVDLGSGPGRDLIHAAEIVGETGKAIGIDMTPEMIELGRKNTSHLSNTEIKQGNLQNIPLEDNSVDVIISNCVFNLTPNKLKAFSEAYRVLKHGGRIVESDVVIDYELTEEEKMKKIVYSGCIGGAIPYTEYISYMKQAGFSDIKADFQHDGSYLLGGKKYKYKSYLFTGTKL